MRFVPRPHQKVMIDIMLKQKRANIFASPGTGKTASVLMALSTLSVVDDGIFPVLVVSTKRIANSVWSEEVEQWFPFFKVSTVLGTVKERLSALREKAHIYTINVENLQWLDKIGSWKFNTVIVDESTLIKSHRCHIRKGLHGPVLVASGSKNARSLVKHAGKAERWYNLTGTPMPNGLKDIWAQNWPIDFGKTLESSYSRFTSRWFRNRPGSRPEWGSIEPLQGAEEEIFDLLKPHTVVIDAYDWLDIKKPIEIDLKFELPSKIREQYKMMEEQSFIELEDLGEVTGVNMGSILMKCRQLAGGSVRNDDGNWKEIHKEKLDVLQELVDRLDGRPLLVAYWFKEDARRIMEKFKHAEILTSGAEQTDTQQRWNDGKIPMLLVHPQSAGHGLNLQHGGNNLCIYTVDWNLEYYAQVIERIGPTRQAQSGYKRPVFVHRIMAKNTWDEVIANRLKSKESVNTAVKEYLGERKI